MIFGRALNNHVIRVRTARLRDAEDLEAVARDSWAVAYAGIIPDAHLTPLLARRDSAWWSRSIASDPAMLVAEVRGEVAGYATFGRAREPVPGTGEVFELYLAPAHQGMGLGEYLFEACRAKLDRMRLPGLLVWALAENTSACEFYRRRGGRPALWRAEVFAGKAIEKVGFRW